MFVRYRCAYSVISNPFQRDGTKIQQFHPLVTTPVRAIRTLSRPTWRPRPLIKINTSLEYHSSQKQGGPSGFPESECTEKIGPVYLYQKPVPTDRNANKGGIAQSASSDFIFNEEHIRRTTKVPTDFEYPEIDDSIDDNPRGVICNTPSNSFKLKSEFIPSGRRGGGRRGVVRCHAYVGIVGGKQILGVGEGFEKASFPLGLSLIAKE